MGKSKLDLQHLIPASRPTARLSNSERINHIRADRWIGYTRARAALDRLDELLAWPKKQRMPNLLILGPTNNGKSMIVEKFRRQYPGSTPMDEEEDPVIPVVVVQMPPEPRVSRFYVMLLASIGTQAYFGRSRASELEHLALNQLRNVKARMLVIDELHNVLAGAADNRREFLNLLRFLGNELRIPLVGIGTREAYLAIRSDDQLENRFEPMLLPQWQEGGELLSLLASFAAVLPLRRPSQIATPDMAQYILTRTEGTIGEIAKLLTSAAIAAIHSGDECINDKTLLTDYQSPTERRRTFERALL